MLRLVSLSLLLLFFGCASKVTETDLKNLNGYWEIKEVTFPNGERKAFKASTNIDYIEIKGLKGFRKKMQPKFDGSFTTSNDANFFSIAKTEVGFEFRYKNEMSEWKEQVLELSQHSFSVINEAGSTYTYQRFQPITIND